MLNGIFLFPISVIHPNIGFLTRRAAPGAVVPGADFDPFPAVGAGDIFGIGCLYIFHKVCYDLFPVTEPEKLFVPFSPAVQVLRQHVGAGLNGMAEGGKGFPDFDCNILHIVGACIFHMDNIAVLFI